MEALVVPGVVDSLKAIRDYVAAAATKAGLESRAVQRLCLAVDEIATNSITHGYQEAGLEGTVRIETHIGERALTLIVEDTGAYYDPTQHVVPAEDELARPLDERKEGGLGILLVTRGVDEFRYERVQNRNRNIFIMNRPSTSSEA